MREIKFRVWDSRILKMGLSSTLKNMLETASRFNEFEELIFLQYIGLKDKNGKEIYEGDIVESDFCYNGIVTFNTNNYSQIPAFHICKADGKSVEYLCGAAADSTCKVIGNIYENPELLGE